MGALTEAFAVSACSAVNKNKTAENAKDAEGVKITKKPSTGHIVCKEVGE